MSIRMRLKDAKFCPFCGLARLERDRYRAEIGKRQGNDSDGPEFLCAVCGAGFKLVRSYRRQLVDDLAKDMRGQRNDHHGRTPQRRQPGPPRQLQPNELRVVKVAIHVPVPPGFSRQDKANLRKEIGPKLKALWAQYGGTI